MNRIASDAMTVDAAIAAMQAEGLPSDVMYRQASVINAGERHPLSAQELRKRVDLATVGENSDNGTLAVKSLTDLLSMVLVPLRYLIQGILPEGPIILGGLPKEGKTLLALCMALAMACGGRALGSIDIDQRWVLYLALEDNDRRLQQRLSSMLKEQDSYASLLFDYATEWPRLNEGGLELIEKWLIAHPSAGAVFIDILEMIRPIRSGKSVYSDDYEATQSLRALANKYHVAIVIVHHTRKLEDPNHPANMLSGSTGLQGAPDGWMILRRDGQGGATLHIRHRDMEDQPDLQLSFNAETLSWHLVGPVEHFGLSDERKAIIATITEARRNLTPKEIAERLGKNPSTVRTTLRKMAEKGQLHNVNGTYGPLDAVDAVDSMAPKRSNRPHLALVESTQSIESTDVSACPECGSDDGRCGFDEEAHEWVCFEW